MTDTDKNIMQGAWAIIQGYEIDKTANGEALPPMQVEIERYTQIGAYFAAKMLDSDLGYRFIFLPSCGQVKMSDVFAVQGDPRLTATLHDLKIWARADFANRVGIDPTDVVGWE